jgi:hypothetical protein
MIVGAEHMLCHKWPHALAVRIAVDWLINAPHTDPVAFERGFLGLRGRQPEKPALSSGRKA